MMKAILFLILSLPFHSFAQDKVQGPWLRSRSGNEFRYISTYTTTTVDRAVKGFPWFQEDCHDNADGDWTQWNQMITYSVNYTGGIGFDLLGFSLEFGRDVGKSHTIGFNRWISASGGITARHALHEVYDVVEGITRMEVKYKNGTIALSDWQEPFKVTHKNYGLRVERTIMEVCDPEKLSQFLAQE